MVNCATHTPFASHTRSPQAPAASHSHTGGLLGTHLVAVAQAAATPHPSCRRPRARSARQCALAQACLAADSGTSVPRPDASAATTTTSAPLRHSAQPPRPTAKTADEFHYNLARRKIAAGFETRQTAACYLMLAPLFGATSAPLSSRITLKNAPAHIAKVIWRYQPEKERTS